MPSAAPPSASLLARRDGEASALEAGPLGRPLPGTAPGNGRASCTRGPGPDAAGTRGHLGRRRRLLSWLCLAWAGLTLVSGLALVSELTPLGHWLAAALTAHGQAMSWIAARAPRIAIAVVLAALSPALRRGRVAAFWLFTIGLAATGPIGLLAGAAAGGWLSPARVPAWFWVAAAVHLGLLALVASQWQAFRRLRHSPDRTDAEETRLRDLIGRPGSRDSLGYFALRDDKSVIFSPTGKAAVSYRVLGGVSLAAGDPLGDPEAWPGAIGAWHEQAERHGWRRAVIGASEQAAIAYRRHAGLRAFALGDEAVIEVGQLDPDGRAMRGASQAHARVARSGYTATATRQQDLTPDALTAIARAAACWRDSPERGFSMALGRLGDPGDPDYLLLQCRDRDNQLRAVLGFVPWGQQGLSLDFTVRDPLADNGLIEYLVTELADRAPALGVERLSLNLTVFREVFALGERIGAGPVLRAHRRLLLASRWWHLESRYQDNVKYQPNWVPRHLCFAARDLMPVLAAAARAEGFLP